MIEIKELYFSFNNKELLKNINLTINDGEIAGIIGRTGAGKTLLLRIIAGLLDDFIGELKINNQDIKSLSKNQRYKTISYMNKNIPNNMEDTVQNFSLLSRMPHKNILKPFTDYDKQVTDEYLNKFELFNLKNEVIGELSDCKLQAVLLAHAFNRESDILILDNPTTNLDLRTTALLQKSIIKYTMNGDKIVLLVSNDLNFITQTSDRIIIMDNGEIAEEGTYQLIDSDLVKQYFSTEVLISRNIYNGRPEIHIFPEH